MLELITMFILGFVFAGCLVALFVIHNIFAEDNDICDMEKWYRENYEEDDQ